MKTRIILAVAVVLILAIALTSGASNMGFKLSQTLAANTSKYVSLPFYNSYSTQTAAYLRNDVIAAGGTSVEVFNYNGSVWQRYAGGGFGQVDLLWHRALPTKLNRQPRFQTGLLSVRITPAPQFPWQQTSQSILLYPITRHQLLRDYSVTN